MAKLLGQLLISSGLITEKQLETALTAQKENPEDKLGSVLIRLDFLDEQKLVNFLGKQFNLPTIDLSNFEIDNQIKDLIPGDTARKHSLIPIDKFGNTLTVAVADPSDFNAVQDIRFITNCEVEVIIAPESQIMETLDKYYEKENELTEVLDNLEETAMEVIEESDDVDVGKLETLSEDAPIIKLVNNIITAAIHRGASDIHIEPYEKMMRIRYRVDGVLFEEYKPPLKLKDLITTRLKIMARLDIAERRIPQDGRIKIKLKRKEVDLRVSILPCIHGEKIVMRILDKGNLSLDLTKLGFEQKPYEDFNKAIHTPWGMLLVTGPTGSGKTTTLYSALSTLNKTTENIMTSEDPVEYNLKGINQVQINADVGLTFAAALRAFLRQDPDIIMVGEIRDYETAELAIKAALTGHLVLSTLHTNDAPATISRLSNMGVEPFMIASSVVLILAQRLVRKICEKCKAPVKIPRKELEKLHITEEEIKNLTYYEGAGCTFCDGSGYKGRIAIYEVFPIHEDTKELIINGEPATVMKRHMMSKGIATLRISAVNKFKQGVTTLSEVYRVTAADED